MKNIIEPTALYWASFNRFELRLPGECVTDCSAQGACDDAVAYWAPRVHKQMERDAFPNAPTPAKIREELAEYGAWSDEELQDDEQNFRRLVWCAACNIADEENPDCGEPMK